MSINQPVGVPFQNPLDYVGPDMNIVPIKRFPRRPLMTDKKYRVGQLAILGKNPSTGTEGELWYLASFDVNGDANWVQFSSGVISDAITSITTDDGAPPVLPDIAGNVDLLGGTGITTSGTGPGNTVTVSIDNSMVGQTITGDAGGPLSPTMGNWNIFGGLGISTSGNMSTLTINNDGVVTISDTANTPVMPNGSGNIQLESLSAQLTILSDAGNNKITFDFMGGAPIVQTFQVDTAFPPGTNPVTPDGFGLITFSGTTAAASMTPVQTTTRALNTMSVEVQLTTTVTPTPLDDSEVGLASFNENQFTVDATSGMVSLISGPTDPALTKLNVDTASGTGTNPVVPDAMGEMTATGNAVNATMIPVQIASRTVNSWTVENQVASAVVGAPGTKDAVGLAQFESTQFTVDADGYVTLVGGGGGIDPLSRLLEWEDFLGSETTDNTKSKLGWFSTNVSYNTDSITGSEPEHPGIWQIRRTTVSFLQLGWDNSSVRGGFYVGGGVLTLTWIVRLTSLSGSTLRIGFNELQGAGSPNTGIWFQFTSGVNGDNFVINSADAGSTTSANTAVAATTDWTRFQIIVNAAGTSIAFQIDGVEVGVSPLITDIPTTRISPFVNLNGSSANVYALCDLMIVDYVLTSSR